MSIESAGTETNNQIASIFGVSSRNVIILDHFDMIDAYSSDPVIGRHFPWYAIKVVGIAVCVCVCVDTHGAYVKWIAVRCV